MISLLCTNFKSRTWDALPTLVSWFMGPFLYLFINSSSSALHCYA
jgi:hypothetical protein